MKKCLKHAASALLILALALCCLACANDKYDFRNASMTASANVQTLTLYEDDTAIVYTAIVPKQCVKLTVMQLSGGTDEAGDPAVLSEQTFTSESEGVSVAIDGDTATWVVPCDFGVNGVNGVRIKAQIPMGKKADYLYADVAVSVDYPSCTGASLENAYESFVCRGADEPYYFTVPAGDEALALAGLSAPAASGERGVAGDYGFLYPADGAPQIESATVSGDMDGMFVPDGAALIKLYILNDDFALCYTGEGLRVSDSARALICAGAGTAPDAALYPVAALLYEKSQGFLQDIPLSELSVCEQLLAIYERVYNEGLMALPPADYAALPETDRAYYERTAYGIMAGFGGSSQGYADALYLMLNMAGVPCIKLPCALVGGEADYCVNAVMLGGEWYVVDAYAAESDALFGRFCLSAGQAAEYYVFQTDAPELSSSRGYFDAANPISEETEPAA